MILKENNIKHKISAAEMKNKSDTQAQQLKNSKYY